MKSKVGERKKAKCQNFEYFKGHIWVDIEFGLNTSLVEMKNVQFIELQR